MRSITLLQILLRAWNYDNRDKRDVSKHTFERLVAEKRGGNERGNGRCGRPNWKSRRGEEGKGEIGSLLRLRVDRWRGLFPTTTLFHRYCGVARVLMRYTIAWRLLNKKYESKMAAFAAIRHREAWFVPNLALKVALLSLSLSQPLQDPRNRNPRREISRDRLMQFGGFERILETRKRENRSILFGNGGSKASGRIRWRRGEITV